MSKNSIAVVGNLTAEPELRFSQAGNAWSTFSIAENNRVRDAAGNWVDGDPNFYDVKTFGRIAEQVAEHARKGTRLVITGELRQERWQNEQGENRSKLVIIADDVGESFLFREGYGHQPAPAQQHQAPAPQPQYQGPAQGQQQAPQQQRPQQRGGRQNYGSQQRQQAQEYANQGVEPF